MLPLKETPKKRSFSKAAYTRLANNEKIPKRAEPCPKANNWRRVHRYRASHWRHPADQISAMDHTGYHTFSCSKNASRKDAMLNHSSTVAVHGVMIHSRFLSSTTATAKLTAILAPFSSLLWSCGANHPQVPRHP